MVVVKLEGSPQLCKTDEVGELCLSSGCCGTGYWGLPGVSNSVFKVDWVCSCSFVLPMNHPFHLLLTSFVYLLCTSIYSSDVVEVVTTFIVLVPITTEFVWFPTVVVAVVLVVFVVSSSWRQGRLLSNLLRTHVVCMVMPLLATSCWRRSFFRVAYVRESMHTSVIVWC